jgi:hypothetical protein
VLLTKSSPASATLGPISSSSSSSISLSIDYYCYYSLINGTAFYLISSVYLFFTLLDFSSSESSLDKLELLSD